jgi:DNA-binding transcriptional MerR regulator
MTKRLLSIGEFAAATQLSTKALRLYDEQRLLPPAQVDTATGYRYYGREQVVRGRLIRALRETGLSLNDISSIVSLVGSPSGSQVESLLNQYLREQGRRHAREKRAFQKAFVMLHAPESALAPEIAERRRASSQVACFPFLASRETFLARLRLVYHEAQHFITHHRVTANNAAMCQLIDPLCDEESQLALEIPFDPSVRLPQSLEHRSLPEGSYAAIALSNPTYAADFTGASDALFDWFDRRSYRASGAPWLTMGTISSPGDHPLPVEVAWAFEPTREA